MIVDRIERYVRDVLCSNAPVTFTPVQAHELLLKHTALREEVEQLAGNIFTRQFLKKEDPDMKGKLRLSACGHCPRQLAYGFHGFPQNGKHIDQRAKVVFFMGDMVELLIVALARVAGCNITNYGTQQSNVSLDIGGMMIPGHPDGLITEADGSQFLLECKSASSFAYKKFEMGEVDEAYLAQINSYLEALDLENCCLVFINKDSGVMSERIINRDPGIVLSLKANLLSVLKSTPKNLPAKRYHAEPGEFYPWQCLYCAWRQTCHPNSEVVLVNKSNKLREKK